MTTITAGVCLGVICVALWRDDIPWYRAQNLCLIGGTAMLIVLSAFGW